MKNHPTTAAAGTLTPRQLACLLALAAAPCPAAAQDAPADADIPEILIVGKRTQNVDKRRTENDTQPYVIFTARQLEKSPALNLEQFLRKSLTMSGQWDSGAQRAGGARTNSQISLRGLGANQTLILIDGRRVPSTVSETGTFEQPDLNALPLAAIERIEILPSTAGGLYGGGATGGAINVILKRDYSGAEATVSAGDTSRGDYTVRRADASIGSRFNGNASSAALAVSHMETGELRTGQRSLRRDARALLFRNAPDQIFDGELLLHGAQPNIRSRDGSLLVLDERYGGQALGSRYTTVPAGYAGAASDRGAALVANAGIHDTAFADDAYGNGRSMLAAQQTSTLIANARHTSGSIETFGDVYLARNEGRGIDTVAATRVNLPADAPNNPFRQAISVAVPLVGAESRPRVMTEQWRATAGAIWRLPAQWVASGDVLTGASRTRQWSGMSIDPAGYAGLSTGLPAVDGRPALDVLQGGGKPLDVSPYLAESTYHYGPRTARLGGAALRLSGPLWTLPAGPLTLSLLAETRRERLDDTANVSAADPANPFIQFFRGARQRVHSAYAETNVPVLGKANGLPFAHKLDATLSVRHDRYRTEAPVNASLADSAMARNDVASTAATAGLRLEPVPGFALRASVGTGFLPPAVDQVVGSEWLETGYVGIRDPLRANDGVGSSVPYVGVYGGNRALRPERSRSVSLGAVFEPRALPGLRFSLDYTSIRKRDEISVLSPEYLMRNANRFPGRVERAPLSDADRARGYTVGAVTRLDVSMINLARSEARAVDVQADYRFAAGRFGTFAPFLVATWQPTLSREALPGSGSVNEAGYGELLRNGTTRGAFNKLRTSTGLAWEYGALTVETQLQFYSRYRITSPDPTFDGGVPNDERIRRQGSARIPSQAYVDLSATYDLTPGAPAGSIGHGMEVTVGIENLFDRKPPLFAEAHREFYSTLGDPRLRRLQAAVRKAF